MFKAKLKISHKGCWAMKLSEKFPDVSFKLNNCLYFEDHTIGIVSARGDSKHFKDIVKLLKSFSIVKKIEIVDEGKDYIYLRLHTYEEEKYETITYYVLKNNCFVLDAVSFKEGSEIWTVGSDDRENISKLYNGLQNLGKVELVSINKTAIESKLTNQQRDIVNLAKELGYYDWPRKISVTKLAKYYGLSKSTFIEHLRKAECKILLNS